jgi:hypothetical protein
MNESFTTLEKWSGIIGNFLIGSLFIVVPITLYLKDYFLFFITLITLFLFLIIKLISKKLYYQIPITFEVAIWIFIVLTLFVGDGLYIYWRYGWYDVVAHALAGGALGFVGFLMIYMSMLRHKLLLPAIYAAIFAFSFSVMLGVMWEFFEYFMDKYLGTQMVKGSGYDDIIWDLLGDTVGALVASIIGFLYLKGKKISLFSNSVHYFVKLNQVKLKSGGNDD